MGVCPATLMPQHKFPAHTCSGHTRESPTDGGSGRCCLLYPLSINQHLMLSQMLRNSIRSLDKGPGTPTVCQVRF